MELFLLWHLSVLVLLLPILVSVLRHAVRSGDQVADEVCALTYRVRSFLEEGDSLTGLPQLRLVLLRGVIVAGNVDLDVLALDLLHRLLLIDVVLPVLVELREGGSNVIDE